jgi:RNA polymerase sigma-70 factor (ECF subfamily)
MTCNGHEAEDLTQETYMRAFRAFDRFRRGSNCKAWLLRILSNLNIDRFSRSAARREKARYRDVEPFLSAPPDGESDAHAALDYREFLDDEVKHALEDTPARFRIPLLLSVVEGMTYAEIARALDCPMGTVMSRIYRGRRHLRRQLEAGRRTGAAATLALQPH